VNFCSTFLYLVMLCRKTDEDVFLICGCFCAVCRLKGRLPVFRVPFGIGPTSPMDHLIQISNMTAVKVRLWGIVCNGIRCKNPRSLTILFFCQLKFLGKICLQCFVSRHIKYNPLKRCVLTASLSFPLKTKDGAAVNKDGFRHHYKWLLF